MPQFSMKVALTEKILIRNHTILIKKINKWNVWEMEDSQQQQQLDQWIWFLIFFFLSVSPSFFSLGVWVCIYGHMYLLTEWSALPLLFPAEPWFTPASLCRRRRGNAPFPGSPSAPPQGYRGWFYHHSALWPAKAERSAFQGFPALLAQGLRFHSSLWFRNIHHVSCSNALGSCLRPLNIQRTSPANVIHRA